MAEYWYDRDSTVKRVKLLRGKYDEVVSACNKLKATMQKYVCKQGKWYDDNSIMLSKWWNQSPGTTSGKLQWDKDKKELVIVNASDGKYDGEDRIRRIIADCAALYIDGVGYSLSCLEDSHKTVKDLFKAEIKVSKNIGQGENMWANCEGTQKLIIAMVNNFGCKEYVRTQLPVGDSNKKRSKMEEMNNFIVDITGNIKNINSAFEDYSKALIATATNPSNDKWWGFDINTTQTLIEYIKDTNQSVESRLNNFQKNVLTALEATEQSKNLNLNKLKKKVK